MSTSRDVSWLEDSQHFITVSRDKQVKLWRVGDDGQVAAVHVIAKLPESATAVSVASGPGAHLRLAVGMDNGAMAIFSSSGDVTSWTHVCDVPSDLAHRSTVRRLKWQPHTPKQVCVCVCERERERERQRDRETEIETERETETETERETETETETETERHTDTDTQTRIQTCTPAFLATGCACIAQGPKLER